ncbi:MAG: cytochrome c [Steroidobacteraceae bacterium]|nr:cytochrome c [Steroidobacteraceae bacterium]MDW8259140.1 c-type cytochrome [Gammaproteobacteria bacterium]
MRRAFAIGVAIVVVALGGAALWWFLWLPRSAPPSPLRVELTPERIERGRYLTINVLQCVDCHSERDWTRYGGPPKAPIGAGRACLNRYTETAGVNVGQETFPGLLCIRNITPDVATGIGGWTDGEIIRAVREGIGRDGRGLFPIMPYFVYRHLSDEDVQAVVAYLRTMQPIRSSQPPGREIDFPLNLLVRLWPQPVRGPVRAPPRGPTVAYGEYLSRIARCEFCHTPRDPSSLEGYPGRLLAGGMPFFLGRSNVKYSMNLTPHATGLGPWSEAQFIERFRRHADPPHVDPSANTLMNWSAFAGMTDDDLRALYRYFRSVPPVELRLEPIDRRP